ncbi:MAG: PEP-CTERM sorting domain-containing protein [Planctomycetota bacterium]
MQSSTTNGTIRATLAIAAMTSLAGAAAADPIDGDYSDTPLCDNHGPLQAVEEFGNPSAFQPSQWIEHAFTITDETACSVTDDPTMPNALVQITNLTSRTLDNLFYVGDPETRFSNVDGNGFGAGTPSVPGLAFRIDSVGANQNLIFESGTFNGLFEPGETWQFIVQDFENAAGTTPDLFFSVGMAGDSIGITNSSASIVRMVPSPGTAALAGLGLAFAGRRRQKNS